MKKHIKAAIALIAIFIIVAALAVAFNVKQNRQGELQENLNEYLKDSYEVPTEQTSDNRSTEIVETADTVPTPEYSDDSIEELTSEYEDISYPMPTNKVYVDNYEYMASVLSEGDIDMMMNLLDAAPEYTTTTEDLHFTFSEAGGRNYLFECEYCSFEMQWNESYQAYTMVDL